jgi:hypothetical protein
MLFIFEFLCVGPAWGAFWVLFQMLNQCRAVSFPAQRRHVNFDWSFLEICNVVISVSCLQARRVCCEIAYIMQHNFKVECVIVKYLYS